MKRSFAVAAIVICCASAGIAQAPAPKDDVDQLLALGDRLGQDAADVDVLAASFERNSEALGAITDILKALAGTTHQILNTADVLSMYSLVPSGKDHARAADLLAKHITYSSGQLEGNVKTMTISLARPNRPDRVVALGTRIAGDIRMAIALLEKTKTRLQR